MQSGNEKQQQAIKKVIRWLGEEGYEPEERTNMEPSMTYFAMVKVEEDSAFHVMFPSARPDCVLIHERISMSPEDQWAYVRLQPLQQNQFYFDLKVALLQMNVISEFQDSIRQLKALKVTKPIYFDGLTKDRLFDTIYRVHHSIEIAKVKFGQFRDSILPSHAGKSDKPER